MRSSYFRYSKYYYYRTISSLPMESELMIEHNKLLARAPKCWFHEHLQHRLLFGQTNGIITLILREKSRPPQICRSG